MYCTGSKEAGNRLLDHWVHGCDALGHDQGLAVGDVVQGRARVTSQYHLREIPGVLINESTPSARAAGLFKITSAPLVLQRQECEERPARGPRFPPFPPLTSYVRSFDILPSLSGRGSDTLVLLSCLSASASSQTESQGLALFPV